jgi:hypothetical protein
MLQRKRAFWFRETMRKPSCLSASKQRPTTLNRREDLNGIVVIDTVVCLTLAKWETVSGHFGGYLRCRLLVAAVQRKATIICNS